MPMDMDEIRSTLNDLIETCKDGQKGFLSSAEKLKDTEIRSLFLKLSRERAQFAGELQAEVTRIGGEPSTSGTTGGSIHRGWMGLQAALSSSSEQDHTILTEAERGEDGAATSYREALNKDLPSDLHKIVRQQYEQIEQARNLIRELRDRPREASSIPMAGLI